MVDEEAVSDIILIARIREHDTAAFDTLFRRYYHLLVVYVARHAWNRDVAEDVVQDVFFQLWLRPPRDVPDAGIRAYLYAIVRNRLINHARDRATRDGLVSAYGPTERIFGGGSPEDDVLGALENEEIRRVLADAVSELPERAREVWELYREHTLGYAEIAAVMGVSVNTVKTQLRRTLTRLRAVVKPFLVVLLATRW
jgi:RNA polymerase sigma-70 factor (ECF subfamily)